MEKSKKRKILLGTLIPASIVLTASITATALFKSPKISTLLLLKECNGYYQKYRKLLENRGKDISNLEKQYKSVDTEVKKVDKELTKLKDDLAKEVDENKKKNIQNNIDKTTKKLGEKDKNMNNSLWKKSKLSLDKVKQEYESWILTEYKNI